jgi:hypothetical protein
MRTLEALLVHAIMGAVLGALTGVASLLLLTVPSWRDPSSSWAVVPLVFGTLVGGVLGAVAGPILGWFVLRRVPVRYIVRYTPLGTLCGAYLASLLAWFAADISDGRGIPYFVGGAVLGLVITAFVLRARYGHAVDLNPMW